MIVRKRKAPNLLLAVLVVATGIGVPVTARAADVDMYDGNTHYVVTPYLWLPGMTGDFNITLPSGVAIQPGATIKPDKYLSDLKFAIMRQARSAKANGHSLPISFTSTCPISRPTLRASPVPEASSAYRSAQGSISTCAQRSGQ
jgi:hypothetical protein